jgi:hypothetical protein
MKDRLTVLAVAPGYTAGKTVRPGRITPYKAGTWFACASIEVDGFSGLVAILERIQHEPAMLVIRGELIEGHSSGRVRKKATPDPDDPGCPYFRAQPRRWIAIDLDSFDLPPDVDPLDVRAVARAGRSLLRPEFQRAACWAQLTGSAGFAPGGRCRLWFWLDRPASDREAKRWLKGSRCDLSLFTPVQPHFVAMPRFVGITDPAPARSCMLDGEIDVVAVPELPEPPPKPKPHAPSWRGSTGRAGAYATACLRNLAGAPPGQGRDQLTRIALRLYGLSKACVLDPVRVTAELKGIMLGRGWDADETHRGMTLADVNRQLQWAWDAAEPKGLDP